MKKIAIVLAALCLVVIAAGCLATTMYVDTPNGNSVNLRDEEREKIGSVPFRAAVEVVGFVDSDTWAEVYYNGDYGFIYTRYLSYTRPAKRSSSGSSSSSSSSAQTQTDAASIYSGFVQTNYTATVVPSTPTNYVNLRWAPSKGAQVEAIRYSGVRLQVIAENGTWCQVIDNSTGISGFMLKKYLLRVEDDMDEGSALGVGTQNTAADGDEG